MVGRRWNIVPEDPGPPDAALLAFVAMLLLALVLILIGLALN